MINLLPPELKTSYSYARKNVALRRWVIIFLVTFAGLWGIATYGLLDLQQNTTKHQGEVDKLQTALQDANYAGTQKQIGDISGSFQLAVKVLEQEVLFSQLLKQIAATMPPKSNLTSLNISQTQGALDISAVATDYNTATQVQVNLSDPKNKIFSKADIVNIACEGQSEDPAYPCTVNVRALFATDNPFLFINSKAKN